MPGPRRAARRAYDRVSSDNADGIGSSSSSSSSAVAAAAALSPADALSEPLAPGRERQPSLVAADEGEAPSMAAAAAAATLPSPPPSRSDSSVLTATSSTPLTAGSHPPRPPATATTTATAGAASGENAPLAPGGKPLSSGSGLGVGGSGPGSGGAPALVSVASKVPPIRDPITVVVLDTAHSKFRIAADPSWTVRQFKMAGAARHRVPAKSQRLIHMGKLLRDEETLGDAGLTDSEKIVHLFPKPNVVVQKEEEEAKARGEGAGAGEAEDGGDGDGADGGGQGGGGGGGGAHVPRIVLDAAEAERRSQILVLSSAEVFEAQHRVKLLSFLLLVISSMELLTLFTILLGTPASAAGYDHGDSYPPLDPTDTSPRGGGAGGGGPPGDGQVRPWRDSDYFDLAVSSFGFYVATLGIKATAENTSSVARRYFYCLVLCGAAWNAYYFYLSLRDLRDQAEDERDAAGGDDGDGGSGGGSSSSSAADDADLYTQAFFSILLPVFVWLLCFLRAFQFRRLIEEAEAEAEERTRSFAAGMSGEDDDEDDDEEEVFDDEEGGGGGGGGGSGGGGGRSRAIPFGMEGAPGAMDDLDSLELQVQVEGRTIT